LISFDDISDGEILRVGGMTMGESEGGTFPPQPWREMANERIRLSFTYFLNLKVDIRLQSRNVVIDR